jgi:hypothetical protein
MPSLTHDRRHQALLLSLQQRYSVAKHLDDAEAKQALFREAVYLDIQPELLDPNPTSTAAA